MLQRVNFAMMLVVLVMIAVVGVQVMRTQSKTADALQGIMADLSRMKFEDGVRAPSAGEVGGLVYIDGDVERSGVYQLPLSGGLTVRRAITAAGGGKGDIIGVVVRAKDSEGNSIVRFKADRLDLRDKSAADYTLAPNDHITVTAVDDPGRPSPDNDHYGESRLPDKKLAGRWVHVDAAGHPVPDGATMILVGRDDIKNVNAGWPFATLTLPGNLSFKLNFLSSSAPNLQVCDATKVIGQGRWEYRDQRLLLNLADTVTSAEILLTLVHESLLAPTSDARAQAVGDFVVRLFALADPNDPNLDQTIRDFLDAEEKALETKHADDPATAGMIRELIAARRKIFAADAAITSAATAEQRATAVTAFLHNVLSSPDAQGDTSVTALQVLNKAGEQAASSFANDPQVQARVRETIEAAKKQLAPDNDDDAGQPGDAGANAPKKESAADQGEVRQDDDHFAKLSPFRAVRWKDQWTPMVEYEGQWFELKSIQGIEARAMMEHCRKLHGDDQARKRFSEDLAQMLIEMGAASLKGDGDDGSVTLQLIEQRGGSVIAANQAKMTQANRESVRNANRAAEEAGETYPVWKPE